MELEYNLKNHVAGFLGSNIKQKGFQTMRCTQDMQGTQS